MAVVNTRAGSKARRFRGGSLNDPTQKSTSPVRITAGVTRLKSLPGMLWSR